MSGSEGGRNVRSRRRRGRGRRRVTGAVIMAGCLGAVLAAAGCTERAPTTPKAAGSSPPVRRLAGQPPKGLVGGRVQPPLVRVPRSAAGSYAVVAGTAKPPPGRRGRLVRYLVEVERGLPFDPPAFAAEVHRILNDPRGWGHGGRMRFTRTDHGPVRVRVSLSSPDLTDERCLPARTGGELSCWDGPRSVINAKRWGIGAHTYRGDLASYREYVINHEVGHQLNGRNHRDCPGRGRLAPVMVQQTKSLGGCRPNPWPHPRD